MPTIAQRLRTLEDAFSRLEATGGSGTDYGPSIASLQAQLNVEIANRIAADVTLTAADTALDGRLDVLEALPVILVDASEPAHSGQKDGDLWVKKV